MVLYGKWECGVNASHGVGNGLLQNSPLGCSGVLQNNPPGCFRIILWGASE